MPPTIRDESARLYKDVLEEHNRILNLLPKIASDVGPDRPAFLARKLLFDSGRLCGQILWALQERRIFMAVIGTKTLIEIEINTMYIFLHPHAKSDPDWVKNKCDIYMDNYGVDDDRLDGRSLSERARAMGLDSRLKTYKEICKIAHGTRFTSLVNVRNPSLEMFSDLTDIEALLSTNNTRSYIETWHGIETNKDLEHKLALFRDTYTPSIKAK